MNKRLNGLADLDVSRETLETLNNLELLLKKWNKHINLVAMSTLKTIWTRHIVDSAQIFKLAPQSSKTWVDLGSGGGFPGLVVAILAQELMPKLEIKLVESDQRKATFLRTAIRETGAPAQVLANRIELLPSLSADVVSARALADLPTLLSFAQRHLRSDGTALFQKGANWQKELASVDKSWSFKLEHFKSKTEERAIILRMKEIIHDSAKSIETPEDNCNRQPKRWRG